MSEPTTPAPAPDPAPAPAPAPDPAPKSDPAPAPQPHTPPSNSANDLLTEIRALPETIVNAIREGIQPPKAPDTPAVTPAAESKSDKPGKKSFVEFWFGK